MEIPPLSKNWAKKHEGLLKSLSLRFSVIPVKTGIQFFNAFPLSWISTCAGMTTFYGFIEHALERFRIRRPGGVCQEERSSYKDLQEKIGIRHLWGLKKESNFIRSTIPPSRASGHCRAVKIVSRPPMVHNVYHIAR
jgi:hypothetical protein